MPSKVLVLKQKCLLLRLLTIFLVLIVTVYFSAYFSQTFILDFLRYLINLTSSKNLLWICSRTLHKNADNSVIFNCEVLGTI